MDSRRRGNKTADLALKESYSYRMQNLSDFILLPIGGRRHIDLAESDQITLRIEHRNMGLGGTNSWGQTPLNQ